ncbi:MAG: glycosyltransferase family 39 protein [Gemmatimonadaceae bacterium]
MEPRPASGNLEPTPRATAGLVAALAVAASVTSLTNGFAFDDLAIIVGNDRVHDLHQWWRLFLTSYWPPSLGQSLYRPLTTLSLGIEWALGHGSPIPFRLTSIALYAVACVLTWHLLRRVTTPRSALIAACLFAVHPVHVEAVANSVGQAELLAAMAILAASIVFVDGRRNDSLSTSRVLVIAALYAAGALCKEHALLLPALLLVLDRFSGRPRPWKERLRELTPLGVTLLAVGSLILVARLLVVGSLVGEKQVVEMNPSTRIWMMFRVAPIWTRLMTFPAHLSAYYGPHDVEVVDGISVWSAVGILLFIGAAAFFVRSRTRHPAVALAIAWLAVTLFPSSNLLSGFIVEEHTLFVPSVGAALLLGIGGAWLWARASRAYPEARRGMTPRTPLQLLVMATGVVVLALGLLRSAIRQPVWKDNRTLFAQTVLDAPRSYRAHYLYGTTLFEAGRLREGERELQAAIALNEHDSDPFNYLATKYREAKVYHLAIPLYRRALALNAHRPDSRFGLAYSLFESGDVSGARAQADTGLAGGQLQGYFRWILARADSLPSREDKAKR